MDVMKIIMRNGNEYKLLWDDNRFNEGEFSMIDLAKGWVTLNRRDISEYFKIGKLGTDYKCCGKGRNDMVAQYGEEVEQEE